MKISSKKYGFSKSISKEEHTRYLDEERISRSDVFHAEFWKNVTARLLQIFFLNHNRLTLRALYQCNALYLSAKSLDNYLFFHYAILLSLHGACRKSVSPRGERPSLICVHVTKILLKQMITVRTPERLWIIITIIRAISSMEKVPMIFLPAKSEKPIDKQAKNDYLKSIGFNATIEFQREKKIEIK